MHACGHDGHMAIAMAVAERLVRQPRKAALRFLYQPAEEGRGGAQACTDEGVLDGVCAALGLHLWSPLPVGKIGINRGALMAAVDNFTIDIEGRGGHGASPHETADPILAAARVVEALQSVVSREISPLDSAVVTIGSIHGGTAFNVIPNSVQLHGTARSFTETTGRALPEKIRRIVEGTASACGVRAKLRYERTNRATVNDARMADLVIDVAAASSARRTSRRTRAPWAARTCPSTWSACRAASSSWDARRRKGACAPTTHPSSTSTSGPWPWARCSWSRSCAKPRGANSRTLASRNSLSAEISRKHAARGVSARAAEEPRAAGAAA